MRLIADIPKSVKVADVIVALRSLGLAVRLDRNGQLMAVPAEQAQRKAHDMAKLREAGL